jgi:hypothetical protein
LVLGDTTATLFPGVYSNSAVGTARDVHGTTATWRFATDYGIATGRTVSPVALATLPTEADFLVEVTWTAATGVTFELDLKYLDADNRWIVRCSQAAARSRSFSEKPAQRPSARPRRRLGQTVLPIASSP